ncbi:hypothetical protein Lfu02_39790 [Longispora fulva]|nr:hypothetical protein Lfu02_39790 [Longispora fulva]
MLGSGTTEAALTIDPTPRWREAWPEPAGAIWLPQPVLSPTPLPRPAAGSPAHQMPEPMGLAELATVLHLTSGEACGPAGHALYLMANHVPGLCGGVFRYRPTWHALVPLSPPVPEYRLASCVAAPGPLARAGALVVVTSLSGPAAARTGVRPAEPHALGQHVPWIATRLGLTAWVLPGFSDEVDGLLGLSTPGEHVTALIALVRS